MLLTRVVGLPEGKERRHMSKADNSKSLQPDTRCIHAGDTVDPQTGAVMPAIYPSSTFKQEAFGVWGDYAYSRNSNPTRAALERCVAELENGVAAFAFASGMAATAAVAELLPAGSHVVASRGMYGGSFRLFNRIKPVSQGIKTDFVDCSDLAAVEAAITPDTKLLWLESPTNPALQIVDIKALAELGHKHGLTVAVDNTFSTPLGQRPIELGADIVMHSCTKWMGGHSDTLGGMLVVGSEELAKEMGLISSATGGVMSPFESYLLLRGIKTLSVRLEKHQANCFAIARFLEKHPKIAEVRYPGLESHPQHELAKQQMDHFGAVVTILLDGDQKAVETMFNRLQLFVIAEGLGGVESMIGHPPTMSHNSLLPEEREFLGIPDNMIRLSPGIENADDLIADLEQALA